MKSLAFALVAFILATPAAAVPDLLTYVGTLHEGGAPADGTYSVTLALYDAPEAGTLLFTQTEAALPVTAGAFIVDIGPVSDDVDDVDALYLALTVNGQELSPRVAFTSVPFARRARLADDALTVGGLDTDDLANLTTAGAGLVKNGNVLSIGERAVTSGMLQTGGVTESDIAPGAVGTAGLASGAVTNSKLAPGAVTTAKIANGQVRAAHLVNAVPVFLTHAACDENRPLSTRDTCSAGSCLGSSNVAAGCTCSLAKVTCTNVAVGSLVGP